MALILFVHACVDSMGGGKTLALTGSTNFKKLYERAVEAAVFTIVLLGVITVIQLYATPSARVLLWPPITVIFFAYYPMAVGLLLLDSDKRRALQPRSVVKAVRELKEHYLLAVLLLIALQPRSVVKAVRELKEHYLLAVLLLIARLGVSGTDDRNLHSLSWPARRRPLSRLCDPRGSAYSRLIALFAPRAHFRGLSLTLFLPRTLELDVKGIRSSNVHAVSPRFPLPPTQIEVGPRRGETSADTTG